MAHFTVKLTPEQREAVRRDDNTLLVACPGGGKTRAIVARLLRSAEEVRGTSRRVGCITYTNAGVEEVDDRLRVYGGMGDEEYCEVSTIHTFCLNNVLRFFYWRFKAYKRGFKILPSDSELYVQLAEETAREHRLPSGVVDAFENLNRAPDGTPIVSEGLTETAALAFWEKIRSRGLIDFTNIVYLSYRIIHKYPSIAHALGCRFAWILVDEFQDTSALQVEILKLLAAEGRTKFFLVGDPYQSIYSFAGARPSLMSEFAAHIDAASDCKLSGNFRSSKPVIAHAERLLPRQPPMRPCGPAKIFTEPPQYAPSTTAFDAITDHFLPLVDELKIPYGECAVLAPTWFSLYRLGPKLRDYGIPVFGVGARPYKRHHLFGLLAEQICSYIDAPATDKIPAIEKGLFLMLAQATGDANFKVFTYGGRVTVFRLIKAGIELRKQHEGGMVWLRSAASLFEDILQQAELLPKSCLGLLPESVEGMYDDMQKREVDVRNLTVSDLGLFANPAHNVKLLTIHQAKGREFDAVAIIDLHDGRLPNWRAKTAEALEENKRVFYVAMTRARRILMYVTDTSSPKNVPSRFLRTVGAL